MTAVQSCGFTFTPLAPPFCIRVVSLYLHVTRVHSPFTVSEPWLGLDLVSINVRSSRGQISAHPIRQRNGTDRNRLAVGAAISAYDQPLRRSRSARARRRRRSAHPLERSRTFSEMSGADVHLKLENFQRTGAFKIRGAMNRIATLSESEREAGVVTRERGQSRAGRRARGRPCRRRRHRRDAAICACLEGEGHPRVRRQRPAGGRRLRRGAGVRPRA